MFTVLHFAIAHQAGKAQANAVILHRGKAFPQRSHQIASVCVALATDHIFVLSN
jgi:hypothetical protein